MATEHRRRTDENGSELHERATDNDAWARLGVFVDHYKIGWAFWIIVVGGFGWVSRNYLQPIASVPVLQAQNAVIITRLDEADRDRKDITRVLSIFGRILCAQTPAVDRYKYDIDCSKLPVTIPTAP